NPLQRKAASQDFRNSCCSDHHCNGNRNVNMKNLDEPKYFKPRNARRRRQDRLRKTMMLLLASMVAVLLTWRITGRYRDGRLSGRYVTDDRFHAKRLIDHGQKHQWRARDPALREKRRQRAEAREAADVANRQEYQAQQGARRTDDKDETAQAAGGIFNAFFNNPTKKTRTKLKEALKDLDERIVNNENRGIRWINMQLIPPLKSGLRSVVTAAQKNARPADKTGTKQFFKARRHSGRMAWEAENLDTIDSPLRDDFVDYTKHQYEYPEKLMEPPALGEYPKLMTLKEAMDIWPQDALDNPPTPLHEDLIHFDYNNPQDMEAALKFREAALPFKITNVPEVVEAGKKWTDEYVSHYFDATFQYQGVPHSEGLAQESADNYFAWYQAGAWDVDSE
ncbi:MAG: hypothetical protein SGILL_002196, partial [Bacillariaceae sp.]